ncbi:MAG: ATP-dependent helicase [Micrococcales bacterium]|nr:ATP-dependent helicase [Micrococcales bacterium]
MTDAREIARRLGLPEPTEQQRAVIEAPPLEPALVVAGAGSGKTETMANRVLWLLANGYAAPEHILGLTFTRKAAGELGARIRARIGQLRQAGLMPGEPDPFSDPTVATYNSFANTIYLENAALLGRDPDGPVLGEAAAWQLARTVVLRSDDDRLPDLDRSPTTIVNAVLELSRALVENVADPEAVRAMARDFARLTDLEPGGGTYQVAKWASAVGALDVLVELAEGYRAEKLRRSAVEYSDQVALALQAVEARDAVATELRDRHRIVLLDEYQDTSVVQTRLLAALFAGTPVMAVGDPNQSIYGWRGASAGNLRRFPRDFGRPAAPAATYALTTSWRNGSAILAAANALVRPLTEPTASVLVPRLSASPAASAHPLDTVIRQTVVEEAQSVARWLRARVGTRRTPVLDENGGRPSAALLLRARRTQARFLEALRAEDVPFHVLGLGGLLAEPEIADLVSALAVLDDPDAGLELVRLLAGARWRIGAADLFALRRVASWLRDRDDAQHRYDDLLVERMRGSVSTGDGGSLVDALDFVAGAPDGHGQLEGFSPAGVERLRDAGLALRRLRRAAALELPDLVAAVEQELRVDIEVAANEHRPVAGAAMEAFSDALRGYLDLAEVGSLGGFLAWLRAAEAKEDLSPRSDPPEPGTVQVLTIHGSKGLEWDAVAVPRVVVDGLPARPQEGNGGWLGFGRLPWEFRGDSADLPVLPWRSAATKKELDTRGEEFSAAVARRSADEERRLVYVAVTRARHRLLLSGSFWATQREPRPPSPFLVELREAGLIDELPSAPQEERNPLGDASAAMFSWPRDPLGGRRSAVESAAALVAGATPALTGPWAQEVELLLRERAERLAAGGRVPVPIRVPASRFKDFVTEPDRVAAGMLRPMPERPYRATRLGTLFHAWVERRYGMAGGSDELDAEPFELDDPAVVDGVAADAAPDELAALERLQETFARSEWADRRPVEVEREIHLPFADRIVICKIDAVYQEGDRFEVVDWKTGRAPRDDADLERKQLQLALYRLAFARWRGVAPELIDAAFYFVADDLVIRPPHVDGEEELLARWHRAVPQDAAP